MAGGTDRDDPETKPGLDRDVPVDVTFALVDGPPAPSFVILEGGPDRSVSSDFRFSVLERLGRVASFVVEARFAAAAAGLDPVRESSRVERIESRYWQGVRR